MNSEFDGVEIKDPPLEEFTSRGSCVKKSCGTCSGLILTVLIGSFLVLKFTAPPKSREIKKLPEPYVAVIPIYDEDNLGTIKLTAGNERSRGLEIIAFLPKIILSPLLLSLDRQQVFLKAFRPDLIEAVKKQTTYWDKLKIMLKEPVSDQRDLIIVSWENLNADASFIEEYYIKALDKTGFKIENTSNSPTVRQFTFTKDKVDGALFIKGNTSTTQTDNVTLTVTMEIPNK